MRFPITGRRYALWNALQSSAISLINASGRRGDLIDFYKIIDRLAEKTGGARVLAECDSRMGWPERGVYFFMEQGETRSDTGKGRRIVRVGTHALTEKSRAKLWSRLKQHKGTKTSGGGNHRGSIFRLIVGAAITEKAREDWPSWDNKRGNASKAIRKSELAMEQRVSAVIGKMPFLWLAINDAPDPVKGRGYIERNTIALLSNWQKPPLDSPSASWLGQFCNRERVRGSGLWNQNHVDEDYDPAFLHTLAELVDNMGAQS